VKSTKGSRSELTTPKMNRDIFCYKILSVHNFPKSPRQSLEIVLILHIWFDCSYLTCVCRYLM